ncbi:MAG: hypothetical protein KIT09_05195 [Bryobacteraceae bacterium]|nr:hypothetical protein [Bryobacteraceae bacterium]
MSAYFTAGGPTQTPLAAGQIPGAAVFLSSEYTVRLGGVLLPQAEVFYVGAAPCCAGLDQLTFRVPANMPERNHELVLTVGGVESSSGPFIAVQ